MRFGSWFESIRGYPFNRQYSKRLTPFYTPPRSSPNLVTHPLSPLQPLRQFHRKQHGHRRRDFNFVGADVIASR